MTGPVTFDAEIRYTDDGVPHIRAGDWGGLGFGQGWACGRDQLPAIADHLLKVRSERARFFGPGPQGVHLATDFGYLAVDLAGRARHFRDAQPPAMRALIAGYLAGYNLAVEEAVAGGTLPEWCAGAEWLRPVDELEFYAHLVDIALLAGSRNLVALMGRAEAPGPDGPVPASPVDDWAPPEAGSNGWAVGGDVTASGHGMVLANPHFPWRGEARFWECHLTIPGEYDVYGTSLLGTPGVQIGFNEGLAWTHTFSCGQRGTIYRLDLSADDPTRYRYGDGERAMAPTTFAISVAAADGTLDEMSRTLWRSHHGPMLNLPLVGWDRRTGYAYRDANLDNAAMFEQFIRMGQATDVDSFRAVHAEVQGIPWVNTLAADRAGRAWFIDASTTPRLSAGAQARFVARRQEDPVAAVLYENWQAVLDGGDPDDEWLDHPGARTPGIEPYEALPQLERRDILLNANDSHWRNSPVEALEGYSVLHGPEHSPRSLRTRQNLRHAERLIRRGRVTREDLIAAVFANESLSAELLVDGVVERARAVGSVEVDGRPVDVAAAVDVLAAWDRRCDVASRGAALWREVLGSFPPAALVDVGPVFAEAFSPDDPLGTPCGATAGGSPDAGDALVVAVARAVLALAAAGIAFDSPLGAVQWVMRGDERIPVHGGGEVEGLFNIMVPFNAMPMQSLEPFPPKAAPLPGRERTGLGPGGYHCDYGASFLMAVELTDDGPEAVGLLAYGQTGDPRRPEHRAGVEAFAAKAVRPLRFREADIEAARDRTVHLRATVPPRDVRPA